MDVAWKRPPYKPIPLSRDIIFRFSRARTEEVTKIVIVIREYKIDLSRLKVTALDNNRDNKEKIRIFV